MPAIRARSTAASVCPARRSTPPSLATSGNKCPGRVKSAGVLGRIANRQDRRRAFGRGDAGPRRAMVDRHGVIGAQRRRVRLDHRVEREPLADLRQDRHAELPAAIGDHEIDRLGRGLFGGTDEVAFVLAVLGVDDDHHPAVADRVDGIFNRGKTAGHADLFQLAINRLLVNRPDASVGAELFGRVADSYYRGSGERSTNGHHSGDPREGNRMKCRHAATEIGFSRGGRRRAAVGVAGHGRGSLRRVPRSSLCRARIGPAQGDLYVPHGDGPFPDDDRRSWRRVGHWHEGPIGGHRPGARQARLHGRGHQLPPRSAGSVPRASVRLPGGGPLAPRERREVQSRPQPHRRLRLLGRRSSGRAVGRDG